MSQDPRWVPDFAPPGQSEAEPTPVPIPTDPPAPLPPVPVERVIERPHPLTGVAKSWVALVGAVFIFGRDLLEGNWRDIANLGPGAWFIGGIIVLILVVNLIRGLIMWRTTTFVTADDEFRIDRNFISSESNRISYAKIQAVDIERSLAARILGLSTVKIDVGGAGGATLEYLGRERAEVLKDHILQRMRHLTPDAPAALPVGPTVDNPPTQAAAQPAQQVVTMQPTTLLLGVLVSQFLPWLFIAVALVVAVMFSSSLAAAGVSIPTFGGLFIGVGGYLWAQLSGNWGFTLTSDGDRFQIRRGLFTTVNQSLTTDRIQAVSIHQDYLQRLTGLYRMRVTVLGFSGGEDSGAKSATILPYGDLEDVRTVLRQIWPDAEVATVQQHPQPSRARWLTPLGFPQHSWGADERVFITHHGWLDHTMSVLPHRRMQSIGLRQGPLQRRLRLASVDMHTTDGPVKVSAYHLDERDARVLLDAQLERAARARGESTTGEPTAPRSTTTPVTH